MRKIFRTRGRSSKVVAILSVLVALHVLGRTVVAEDWPMYRHDVTRSGVTAEKLDLPLSLQWVHQPRHAPKPAWPDPERELHRQPFDYAFQVSVANGLLYFGSSADNKVYALDAATGKERWSFFTGGPVRFAPAVWKDRVLAASDDGWLYCLSASDGKVIWKFRGAASDEKLLGNERMISHWPLRTGVTVDKGTAYFAAGMWPSEGVYMYALRVSDGTVVWKTGDATGDFAPQGYILVSGNGLIVPTGRSIPAIVDRRTGTLLSQRYTGCGSWISGADGLFFSAYRPKGTDFVAAEGKPREGQPHPGDGLRAWTCRGRGASEKFVLRGDTRAIVADKTVYAAGSGELTAYDLKKLLERKKPHQCVKWYAPSDSRYAPIMAGTTVFTGGLNKVTAIDTTEGKVVWTGTVHGKARGLAVADGRLFVSTDTGEIACFSAGKVSSPARISAPPTDKSPYGPDKLTPVYAELAERIIKETGVKRGYCLDIGAGDGRLAFELAKRTDLKIYCLEPDAAKVAAARKALDAAGLYGVRITVDQGQLNELPYNDYSANLIVSGTGVGEDLQDGQAEELYRVLRPCGGVAYLTPAVREKRSSSKGIRNWLRKAGIPKKEIQVSPRAAQLVRGPLPGAGDWTHTWADAGRTFCGSDRLLRWPLGVLWFGEPGPARLMSRHMYFAGPVAANGVMFMPGEHRLLAVDIYNGHELWRQHLPWIGRLGGWLSSPGSSNLVADAENLYVAIGDVCLALDARTGRQKQLYELPAMKERFVLDKPRTFKLEQDSKHFGTVTLRNTKDALELKLVTTDPIVTSQDAWELGFDFRPAEKRGGLYGPGAFQAIIVPASETRPPAVSMPCAQPPKIDGTLDDVCWDGAEPLVLTNTQTRAVETRYSGFLRHDKDNLYVAFRCVAARKAGKPLPWKAKTKGEDALVDKDDSWELFLSDKRNQRAVRLGVAASGARYDGIFGQGSIISMNFKWTGKWSSAVSTGAEAWTSELAIPWETLKTLGLKPDRLTINVKGTLFDAKGRARTAELRSSYFPHLKTKTSGLSRNQFPVQFFPVSFTATPKARKQPASWKRGLGPKHPDLTVTGTLTETGSETIVRLPWDEVAKLVGKRRDEFAFGVTLNFSDGGHGAYVRYFRKWRLRAHDAYTRHKFLNPRGSSLTHGWATFALSPAATEPVEQPVHNELVRELLALSPKDRPWQYVGRWDNLLIGSSKEYIYAFNKQSGKLSWIYKAGRGITPNGVAVHDDKLFMLDAGKVTCLNVKTGKLEWKTEKSLSGPTAIRAAQQVVLAVCRRELEAYSAKDGTPLWSRKYKYSGPNPSFPGKPSGEMRKEWMVINGDTLYVWPYAYDLRTGQQKARKHPVTGEAVSWTMFGAPHVRIVGCATGIIVNDLLAQAKPVFIDLVSDDGTQVFPGTLGWDSFAAIVTGGVLMHPPACSTCTCNYSFLTTLALAPARRRNYNRWFVHTVPPGTGRVRKLAFNLGGPADRRDEQGNVWLGFPQGRRNIYRVPSMKVPADVEGLEGDFGAPQYFRLEASELSAKGCPRPWLYSSGCRGPKTVSLPMDLGGQVISLSCEQPPTIDGKLDDPCWADECPIKLVPSRGGGRAVAFARHTPDGLFLAFRQDRTGRHGTWVSRTKAGAKDARVWGDDSFEVFLSESGREGYVHIGVSVSGAQYDAKHDNGSEDVKWSGKWTSATHAEKGFWTLELAIPWKTLKDAGISSDRLEMNIRSANPQYPTPWTRGPRVWCLRLPGRRGWDPCERFVPVSLAKAPSVVQKPYTIRLHFIEPDDAKPGQRVFDVKIQGKTVLKNLDIVKEAGGPNMGLVREFKDISVNGKLKIEFVPTGPKEVKVTASTAPVLCGLEVVQQDK